MDYYNDLKPCFNKLTQLNVWDSLYTIRQYINKYIDNYNLDKTNLNGIEHPNMCPINLYIADFLTCACLKYSKKCRCEHSLRYFKTRSKICKTVNKVYDEANEIVKKYPSVWLKSHALSQYKMQHYQFFYERIYKYYYLYSTDILKDYVHRDLGISLKNYFLLGVTLYFYYSRSLCIDKNNLQKEFKIKGNPWKCEEFEKIISILSCDIDDIRNKIHINCSDSVMLFFSDSPHVNHPILFDNDNFYCSNPLYILYSCIEGLQFHLDLKAKKNIELNKALATNLENYIGEQLLYYSNDGNFKYIKELSYSKGRKTSDWIIYDDECVVFLDCKLKKLTVDASRSLSLDIQIVNDLIASECFKSKDKIEATKKSLSPLMKDVFSLGVDMGKIFCSYYDWSNNKIKEFTYDKNLKVCAIILSLEELFCEAFEIKGVIDRIALAYLNQKRNCHVLQPIKTKIISSSTFDGIMPLIKERGLYKTFIEDDVDMEYKENSWLKKGFEDLIKD